MDFIPIWNGSEDFDLQILYLHVCPIFYCYWDIRVLVLKLILLPFRFYNGCVLRNVVQARVSHMTSRVELGWDKNWKTGILSLALAAMFKKLSPQNLDRLVRQVLVAPYICSLCQCDSRFSHNPQLFKVCAQRVFCASEIFSPFI